MKFNPMGWKQERNFVVTNKSVLNLKKKGTRSSTNLP